MNARRRRGKLVVYEENEECREDDGALGYTSIDGRQMKEEAL